MKKPINLTPVLTREEFDLVQDALHLLATRNYDLSQQESIFHGLLLNARQYSEIRGKAERCVKLNSRLSNLYLEKVHRLSLRNKNDKVKE